MGPLITLECVPPLEGLAMALNGQYDVGLCGVSVTLKRCKGLMHEHVGDVCA